MNDQEVMDRAEQARISVEAYLANGGTMQDTTPAAMKIFMEFVNASNELFKVAYGSEGFLRKMTGAELKIHREKMWASDANWFKKTQSTEITPQLIKRITFQHNGQTVVCEVGQPASDIPSGYPIRAIYRDAVRGCYLICNGDSVNLGSPSALVEEYQF